MESAPPTDTRQLLNLAPAPRPSPDARSCPHCTSDCVVRWGGFSGRHRFRCKHCRRTFSDHTGTCLAYLKRTDVLLDFAAGMQRNESIRAAATRLGLAPSSAFRLRHRLLAPVRKVAAVLDGRIHVSELVLRHSQKGCRKLHRPARRRGGGPASGHDRVIVVFARQHAPPAEKHACAAEIAGRYMLTAAMLRRALLPRLAPRCTLVAPHGRFSAYGSFCNAAGLKLEPTIRSSPAAARRAGTPAPPPTAPELNRRFRSWLEPFRGVATRYLDHYLGWFLFVLRFAHDPDWACKQTAGHSFAQALLAVAFQLVERETAAA